MNCEKHRKPWFEHTDAEKTEDGFFQAGPGLWRKIPATVAGAAPPVEMEDANIDIAMARARLDAPPQPSAGYRRRATRMFDAGVVPDLACPEGEQAWKNYEPGVGPIIQNNAELRNYLTLTGHTIEGQTEMREEKRAPKAFGYVPKKGTMKRVDHGFEPIYQTFRRDPQDMSRQRARHEERQRFEAQARAQKPEPRKIYFLT